MRYTTTFTFFTFSLQTVCGAFWAKTALLVIAIYIVYILNKTSPYFSLRALYPPGIGIKAPEQHILFEPTAKR